MTSQPDWSIGLIPAIIQDSESKQVLMMAYMNQESWNLTHKTGWVTFFSRKRNQLWTKGETSGNKLHFVSASVDCDRDTILVKARPQGPVCHTGTPTCFDVTPSGRFDLAPNGQNNLGRSLAQKEKVSFLSDLTQIIRERSQSPDQNSYCAKLFAEGLDRIIQKVGEEAIECVIAAKNQDQSSFEGEVADLVFHLMVLLQAKDTSLEKIASLLQTRHQARTNA